MLHNIKSRFFLKELFSHIIEGKKLKISKYNKNLQKYQDIYFIHYKLFSDTYRIYGIGGKVKEYDSETDKLIFEGYYLNGKKNGRCKEYYYEGKFQGEYLNGKRNGRGKEYDYWGNLSFEGKYLNDNKFIGTQYKNYRTYKIDNSNGVGEDYDIEGNLIFKGEYLNGEKNGKGRKYDTFSHLIFEGE